MKFEQNLLMVSAEETLRQIYQHFSRTRIANGASQDFASIPAMERAT